MSKIKLKLRSFDHKLLDKAVGEIVVSVKRTGAELRGPIPLPRAIERFTVNRSPHIDKESREQFEIREFTRLLIVAPTAQTVDELMRLELPSGVDVELKLTDDNVE